MHSLSIIIGAKTALGRALLAIQDPAEIVVCAARDHDEAQWLASHYPWFPVIEKFSAHTELPYTRGPIRIYFCNAALPGQSDMRNDALSQSMFSDLGILHSIVKLCGNHTLHIAFASTASAALPSPLSIRLNTIEHLLEELCIRRPHTLLSVFRPGKCIDSRINSSALPFWYTSYIHLGRCMMKAAVSSRARRTVIGFDAHVMFALSHVRNMWRMATQAKPVKALLSNPVTRFLPADSTGSVHLPRKAATL